MPGSRQTRKVSMAFQVSKSPQVCMVWSYFNNLERGQTEVSHAIRERTASPYPQ